MDNIKIVMLLQGLIFLFLVIFAIDVKKTFKSLKENELDSHERVLAQEMARLEYEDRKIELARKKAEEEAKLKAEAEARAIEQEEINKLEEEARSLGNNW